MPSGVVSECQPHPRDWPDDFRCFEVLRKGGREAADVGSRGPPASPPPAVLASAHARDHAAAGPADGSRLPLPGRSGRYAVPGAARPPFAGLRAPRQLRLPSPRAQLRTGRRLGAGRPSRRRIPVHARSPPVRRRMSVVPFRTGPGRRTRRRAPLRPRELDHRRPAAAAATDGAGRTGPGRGRRAQRPGRGRARPAARAALPGPGRRPRRARDARTGARPPACDRGRAVAGRARARGGRPGAHRRQRRPERLPFPAPVLGRARGDAAPVPAARAAAARGAFAGRRAPSDHRGRLRQRFRRPVQLRPHFPSCRRGVAARLPSRRARRPQASPRAQPRQPRQLCLPPTEVPPCTTISA